MQRLQFLLSSASGSAELRNSGNTDVEELNDEQVTGKITVNV